MKFLSIFFSYFCIIYTQTGCFIITEYDDVNILGNYYFRLLNHTHNQIGSKFSDNELENLCHRIRNSRIFKITNSAPIPQSVLTNYQIPQEKLNEEKIQPKSQSIQMRVKKSERLQKLPSITCVNLEGELKWFITKAFIPNSAFLFVIKPEFSHTIAREHGFHRKTPPPQLTALIDESASFNTPDVLLPQRNYYNLQEFMDSMAATDFEDRDVLCDLSPMIRYRLCAIAAEYIESNFTPIREGESFINDKGTFHSYPNRTFNLYYPPTNSKENCQNPIIYLPRTFSRAKKIPRKLLFCSFMITNRRGEILKSQFHLGQNVMVPTAVFIFWFNQEENETSIEEVEIPLLKNLPMYEKALHNFN